MKMSNREVQKVLDKLYEVRPEKLNNKGKRLFNAIMIIADERYKYEFIINDLEKFLYARYKEWKDSDNDIIRESAYEDKRIYDYLKELKEEWK